MVESPFDPRDHAQLIGPADAFNPSLQVNGSVYALQNHLALEIVAQLVRDGIEPLFQGGTPLHVKLGTRARLSTDADVRVTSAARLHESLRRFVAKFPNSGIRLLDPPTPMRVDGVRHILLFPRYHATGAGELRVVVEVVEDQDPTRQSEPLRLQVDAFDWAVSVAAPTYEAFAAQKLAVLGPNTIGKRVGRNEEFARGNQSVCKQLFDLRELLQRDLKGAQILRHYQDEVAFANRLRGQNQTMAAVVEDALGLLEHLRPARADPGPDLAHGLWAGFDDSRRWIRARDAWTPLAYRQTGGALHLVFDDIGSQSLHWQRAGARAKAPPIPDPIAKRLNDAVARGEPWVPPDRFGGSAALAWAWSPRDYGP